MNGTPVLSPPRGQGQWAFVPVSINRHLWALSSRREGRGNSEPSGRGRSHSAKGSSLRNEVVVGTLEPVFREAKVGHRLGEGDQGRAPLAFPTASLLLFSASNNKPPSVVGPEARLPHPVSRQDSNGYPTPHAHNSATCARALLS